MVLPGFDTSLTGPELAALLDDSKNAHGHPQFGLARLLKGLGAAGADVVDLDITGNPRTTLIRRALAPTEATALWAAQRLTATELDAASTGLSIIAARTEDEEARAIALAARAALVEGKTVGIVTPDGNLARRIAAAAVICP